MSVRSVDERKEFTIPEDGEFRVIIDGVEHEYAVDEGDEIALEWDGDAA